MARKKKPEEHENLERWLVSYADFITLLFAFFVVMYAISSVNEGKYRVMSDSLIKAFRTSQQTVMPIPLGQIPITTQDGSQAPNPIKIKMDSEAVRGKGKGRADAKTPDLGVMRMRNMRQIRNSIEKNLKSLIQERTVSMREGQYWLEVEVDASLIFQSGSAELTPQSMGALRELAAILRDYSNPVHVEGFTDSMPIMGESIFPSNWELSAARAASVVHLFTDEGLDPRRMAAVGYGEHRPIADNSTPQGRNKNRRVVLVVMATDKEKHVVDVDRRQAIDRSAAQSAPTQ